MLIGALWGLLGGVVYAILFFVVGAAIESGTQAVGEALFVGILIAIVVGAPAGAALGAATLALLAGLLERRRPASRRTRLWVGVAVSVTVALLVHLVLVWPELMGAGSGRGLLRALAAQAAWFGIPTLLYILAGAAAAVRYFAPSASAAPDGHVALRRAAPAA